ncbi:hypothetical protein J2W55_000022 [Mucilaginibacter pocheonensis]|uniref:Uncharacterized protein n=1 Tax=Mucilaginibacter pocheonensis TaxID=398050 RepID=A0ABU1T485_9SPHI|nr:hypothetical protein [Mucilaginibacter pocheonensis]
MGYFHFADSCIYKDVNGRAEQTIFHTNTNKIQVG